MGQKVNPKGIRIGITRTWDSNWFAKKGNYAKLFHEDIQLEDAIRDHLQVEGIAKMEIMRNQGKVLVNIYTSKPGMIIGRGGEVIEELKAKLKKQFNTNFTINIKEVKKPMLEAEIVAENLAKQVERRVSYRRAAKMAVQKIMEAGASGVKIYLGGRLNGVEIARGEFFTEGKIPLHTFRADIDYASRPASTTYGQIGIKVWIYKGDIFKEDLNKKLQQQIEDIKQA